MADEMTGQESAAEPGALKTWIRALRVKHWTKSFFVVAPFLASEKFGFNDDLFRALAGAGIFALAASAVYLLNDLRDRESDRIHPKKRHRPIASGRVSASAAVTVAVLLSATALGLGALLDTRFLVVLIAYAVNNVLYAVLLKEKTVVDVMSIALGFVLRIFAGGFAVDIEITQWLVACVFSLSLLLGFGKRRGEYEDLRERAAEVRLVHMSYTIPKLDLLLGISAAVTIVTYMLYTMAPDTTALHGTNDLLYTTPFVAYCIYRYTLKVQEGGGGDPVEVVFRDFGFLAGGTAWLVLFLYIIR